MRLFDWFIRKRQFRKNNNTKGKNFHLIVHFDFIVKMRWTHLSLCRGKQDTFYVSHIIQLVNSNERTSDLAIEKFCATLRKQFRTKIRLRRKLFFDVWFTVPRALVNRWGSGHNGHSNFFFTSIHKSWNLKQKRDKNKPKMLQIILGLEQFWNRTKVNKNLKII